MLLGVQVSTEGGILEAFKRAKDLGCNTMQIFSRNPQSWRQGFLEKEQIEAFLQKKKQYLINPIFIHIPYLINLASPNKGLYNDSIEAYIEDIFEAYALDADYIVTHMGSHKDTSEKSGLKRLTKALNIILEETKYTDVGILLENTSGSGSWLGYKFSHQKEIIQNLKEKNRVGLCLDTAHAYLAGYNISTEEGLKELLTEIEKLLGLNLIKLIHLNDAKGSLGCRNDRHANIGEGSIGIEGIKRIINHPKLRNLPFILETPKKTEEDDIKNLATVRRLRQDK